MIHTILLHAQSLLQHARPLCLVRATRLKRTYALLALLALLGCDTGDSGPLGFDTIDRQTEIIIQANPDLAAVVQIDSAYWQPRFLGLSLDDAFEIEGNYTLQFSNLSNQILVLRYDLRFFDAETFLVDVFNPFNLPLRLAPGTSQHIRTAFIIRADDLRQAETLALMQVTIQLDTLTAAP